MGRSKAKSWSNAPKAAGAGGAVGKRRAAATVAGDYEASDSGDEPGDAFEQSKGRISINGGKGKKSTRGGEWGDSDEDEEDEEVMGLSDEDDEEEEEDEDDDEDGDMDDDDDIDEEGLIEEMLAKGGRSAERESCMRLFS